MSAAERMKLYRLRKAVKRGTNAKRVRWQHLTEEQAYDLQLRRQSLRDQRHDQYLENLIKDAVASGANALPASDEWGAAMPDSPSGKGYPLSINDEEALDALNHETEVNGRKVKPAGRGPVIKKRESAEDEDTFIQRHVTDDSKLRCFAIGCKRLVWGVRIVEGKDEFCCDLHQPIS
jgi:hypothetical protein